MVSTKSKLLVLAWCLFYPVGGLSNLTNHKMNEKDVNRIFMQLNFQVFFSFANKTFIRINIFISSKFLNINTFNNLDDRFK